MISNYVKGRHERQVFEMLRLMRLPTEVLDYMDAFYGHIDHEPAVAAFLKVLRAEITRRGLLGEERGE